MDSQESVASFQRRPPDTHPVASLRFSGALGGPFTSGQPHASVIFVSTRAIRSDVFGGLIRALTALWNREHAALWSNRTVFLQSPCAIASCLRHLFLTDGSGGWRPEGREWAAEAG